MHHILLKTFFWFLQPLCLIAPLVLHNPFLTCFEKIQRRWKDIKVWILNICMFKDFFIRYWMFLVLPFQYLTLQCTITDNSKYCWWVPILLPPSAPFMVMAKNVFESCKIFLVMAGAVKNYTTWSWIICFASANVWPNNM